MTAGVVAGVLLVVGVGVGIKKIADRRKRAPLTETPGFAASKSFESSVTNYLAQARSGSLSLDVLDQAISSTRLLIDKLRENESRCTEEIALIETLLPHIHEFTVRLASANSVEVGVEPATYGESGTTIAQLFLECLETQKEVFQSYAKHE